jgi:uncharacterized protein (DUF2249 family)
MPTKVTVKLPDSLYRRTQRFAHRHEQNMEEAISTLLEQALSAGEAAEIVSWSEPDPAVEREMQAYIALHPTLVKHYLNTYVAIYQGELIDHDDDPAALLARIEARYPDQFVWTTQVGPEPLRTFAVRSPRILRDDAP